MQYDVRGDIKSLLRHMDSVPDKVIKPATNAAINKTLTTVRARAVRDLNPMLAMPSKVIRKRLMLVRSSVKRQAGSIIALTAPVRADNLGKPKQNSRGVRVGRRQFPGSFVATMKSGKTGVFNRKGKRRLPIKNTSVDIYPVVKARLDKLSGRFQRVIFARNFNREAQFRFNRLRAA